MARANAACSRSYDRPFHARYGSPVQVHDYNGGIQPSGLFWVVELPGDAFQVNHGGQRATLEASDVCVIDSFQFLGPNSVPATVSFTGRWQATGTWERRGSGSAVSPTDPAAFLGRFAPARATGSFPGRSWGSASGLTRGQLRRRVCGAGPRTQRRLPAVTGHSGTLWCPIYSAASWTFVRVGMRPPGVPGTP